MDFGDKERVKVPDEFVVQKNSNANPPTLLLPLYDMFGEAESISQSDYEYLQRAWPRLVTWYDWFNTTQVGREPSTYYWQGRDPTTKRELNPKSFSSGLDDYPRASHPTDDERHLDLRCWMTLASKLMSRISELIGKDGQKYVETWQYLADNKLLDKVHWSTKSKRFADYGLHSTSVKLKRPKTEPGMSRPEMIREVLTPPTLGFVDDTFGYVSLFPLFTHILSPSSQKLGKILDDLKNPNLLWTKYGLRSLAKNSPLYDKRNTEHDPPYWRGAIWINMNYLTLKALHHYSNLEGPYQIKAKVIHNELKENLITNLIKEYYKTGYIWEQYSDKSGEGMGCRPFTGWSSLIVLIMADIY
ncbi:mannosyl-oligosaccharide glucosidase-like [Artemia franciscana]|uniref:mannosyl-oligosaccharide glucosidase-like n=1 Tax=Artemia franciscana TaxID=6661 RepID=UPI0032DB89E1